MKKHLLLLCLMVLALPGIAQEMLYLKSISYLDYSKISPENKKFVGGFSAIEYNPADESWTIVSDRGKGSNHSYIFNPTLADGSINKDKWHPARQLDLSNVESYRLNKKAEAFVVVEDDNDGFIGQIVDGGKVKRLSPKEKNKLGTENRGIESLTFMPGSNDLWYAYESGTATDCEKDSFTTFYQVRYNTVANAYDFKSQRAFTYNLNRCECLSQEQSFGGNYGNGVSEILAYDENSLLILERCYNGKTTSARIFSGEISMEDFKINKRLLFDFNDVPGGLNPGNLEGMTFKSEENGSSKMIYLISDDNHDQRQETRLIVLSEKEPDKGSLIYLPGDPYYPGLTENDKLTTRDLPAKVDIAELTSTCESSEKVEQSTDNKAQNDKSKTGLFCKLATCICKLTGCKPGIRPSEIHKVTFQKDGSIISEVPGIIMNRDCIHIEVKSPKDDSTQYVLNKRFAGSIDFLKSQKDTSPLLNLLQFKRNVDAATFIAHQRKSSYIPYLNDNAQYTISLNAKPLPSDKTTHAVVWAATIKVPKAADDRERQNLTLTKIDLDNTFLKDVFKKSKGNYQSWNSNKDYFDTLFAEYRYYGAKIDRLQLKKGLLANAKSSCNCPKYDAGLTTLETEICSLLKDIKESQSQLCALATQTIKHNASWIRSWLWYTGGKPKLNPFGIVSEAEFNSHLNKKLAIAEAQLQMYNDFSKQNRTEKLTDLEEELKPHITKLAAIIAELKAQKEQVNKPATGTGNWLTNHKKTGQILNKVLLYSTNDSIIHWMNHYDAKDEFLEMNKKDALPERIYEKDVVHGLVHNLTAKQKISSKETVTKTELRTELDIFLEPLGDAATQAVAATKRGTESIAFAANLKGRSNKPNAEPEKVVDCTSEVALYNSSKILIEWLNEQTEPPLAEIQEAYDKFDIAEAGPVYRSQEMLISESRSALGTNIISYEIFEEGKDRPMIKDKYQTYENVHFWPFVSVNYVFGSRASTIFDNTTNTFKAYTEMDNFEVFAGAKYYLGPSNVTRTPKRSKFIEETVGRAYQKNRGNGFGGKTFLFLGLGIRHKFLKNYGVGGGLDIVPGLSFNGGLNIYFDKKYELVNGIVRKDFDVARFRGFIGLAIDVNVVTRFVSLF